MTRRREPSVSSTNNRGRYESTLWSVTSPVCPSGFDSIFQNIFPW